MFGDLSIFVRIPFNYKWEVFLWLMCKTRQKANKQTNRKVQMYLPRLSVVVCISVTY